VIFHFFDDYSKSNLRIVEKRSGHWKNLYPQKKAWMTWAPSHVELGLLGELLRYANIVGGLRESEKRKMREVLEGTSAEKVTELIYGFFDGEIRASQSFDEKEPFFVVELCSEYIDYLKEMLKPYLK
jgi:hypothetical protein